MRKRGRADLAFIGLVRSVGDQIDAELALGGFHRRIDLPGRHAKAFGVEFEVMDQRFHRALHLAAARGEDLVVLHRDRTLPIWSVELRDALSHDAHRLAHFFHADAVPVVAVAVLADRNIEVHFGVAFIGLRLAQVPRRAGAADHHAGKTPLPGLLQRHHTDVDIALLEDTVAREQAIEVIDHFQEGVAERLDVVDQLWRQVLVHAADTKECRVHARARRALVKHHQLFALFETPQRRGERTNVHRLRSDVEKMRQETADLAVEHADQLAAARHLDAQQLFGRKAKRVLLVHRGDIVEPVEIRDRLQIGLMFDQFFGSAMEQTDVRIDTLDNLSIKFQHKSKYAVGRRMLGAEVDGKIANASFWHAELSAFAPPIRGCPNLTSFSRAPGGAHENRSRLAQVMQGGRRSHPCWACCKCYPQTPPGLWLFLKPSSQILARLY